MVSSITDEVIAHPAEQAGAEMTVIREIEASVPNGASDQSVRIIWEQSCAEIYEPRIRE
ncbi:MAG: hypothetical protein K8S25_18005 [Alphaproteobacteria bacterium]|nr:hypothetical protein [Alphaproteobacteria bacterium]